MNRLRTMTQIIHDRLAARANRVNDAGYAHQMDAQLQRRMDNDPALGIVVATYADSLAQIMARFPPETHREFIRHCLMQAIVEWEDVSIEYDQQFKTNPVP